MPSTRRMYGDIRKKVKSLVDAAAQAVDLDAKWATFTALMNYVASDGLIMTLKHEPFRLSVIDRAHNFKRSGNAELIKACDRVLLALDQLSQPR